jgi:hypothetical protein
MEQLGPAFQILDQPDHRQRIPVTVVEYVNSRKRANYGLYARLVKHMMAHAIDSTRVDA